MALPAALQAQTAPLVQGFPAAEVHYELGGAATKEARLPGPRETPDSAPAADDPFRFPERVPSTLLGDAPAGVAIGALSVFGSEERGDGRDVLRLGTALTSGRTTTGVSFSYDDDWASTRSEVFVDYALTDAFSVGLSGILTDDGDTAADPIARLGLSAAWSLESGSFVQGGVADAPDTSAVFGVSLGLRF